MTFTKAQKKAMAWLPADDSWRINPGRTAAALHSLACYHRGLTVAEFGDFGPRGGRTMRYRLTDAGVKTFAALS